MVKIVIGGQIDKQGIERKVKQIAGEKVEAVIKTDIEAAMMIKSGQADFYLGACNTGGGGALAMAIAILGTNNCVTLSMPGNIKTEEEIREIVKSGKKAFGFTAEHIDHVVPVVIGELLK